MKEKEKKEKEKEKRYNLTLKIKPIFNTSHCHFVKSSKDNKISHIE
jgi:hypothetical protein